MSLRILAALLAVIPFVAFGETSENTVPPTDSACRTWEWVDPKPYNRDLKSVASGDSGLVAVGDYGTILFSPKGVSWTEVNSGTTQNLQEVIWTGSEFVAVGFAGTVKRSTDGRVWTEIATDIKKDFGAVVYGNGLLVALADDRFVLTSEDGASWTVFEPVEHAGFEFTDIVWTGSQFIAIGTGNPEFNYVVSSDGQEWEAFKGPWWGYDPRHLPSWNGAFPTWNGVIAAWNGLSLTVMNYFYAFAQLDGFNWSRLVGPYYDPFPIIGTFAVESSSSGILSVGEGTWFSPDGASWTQVPDPFGKQKTLSWGVEWDGEQYVVVGEDSAIAVSPNLTQWSMVQAVEPRATWYKSAASGNGLLVAPPVFSTGAVSTDGFNWSSVPNTQILIGEYLSDIAFGNGLFVGVGGIGYFGYSYGSGRVGISTDGVDWESFYSDTEPLSSVTWAENRFVAALRTDGILVSSTDGRTWTTEYSGHPHSDNKIHGLTSGNGQIVAVGKLGSSSTPLVFVGDSDGVWRLVSEPFADLGLDGPLYDIAYGAGRWVAVGSSGLVVTSTDLEAWQVEESGINSLLYTVSWNGSEFVAAGYSGSVLSSPDGLTWTKEELPTNLPLWGLEWFENAWYAFGSSSAILRGACSWPPELPVADFVIESPQTAPEAIVSFSDRSTGHITSYFWQFGDGVSSTATNPSHIYEARGAYEVSLKVCNTAGCETKRKTIDVAEQPPKAKISWSGLTLLTDQEIQWMDLSSGPPKFRAWSFGDGSWSREEKPTHTYSDPGIYDVRFMAMNGSGLDWANHQIVVGPPAVVATGYEGSYYDVIRTGTSLVAVGYGYSATSEDGVTWTHHPLEDDVVLTDLCKYGNRFVAVGYKSGSSDSFSLVAESADGKSWNTIEIESYGFDDIACTDNLVVTFDVVGFVYSSADLEIWQKTKLHEPLMDIAASENLFVATINAEDQLVESVDGINWTPANIDLGDSRPRIVSVAWTGETFILWSDGVWGRNSDGTWSRIDRPLASAWGNYPPILAELTVAGDLLLGTHWESLWWFSQDFGWWLEIPDASGSMAVLDDAVIIVRGKKILRLEFFSSPLSDPRIHRGASRVVP